VTLQLLGKKYYGESQADIRTFLEEYSRNNYPTEHYADAVCFCGSNRFELLLDDVVGAAVRVCSSHAHEHPIGDSADYLDPAKLGKCQCPCGCNEFEISAGVALYRESSDVKWLYIGCRCTTCGLVACYGDWKNEFEDCNSFFDKI